jgi:hypothetical protein
MGCGLPLFAGEYVERTKSDRPVRVNRYHRICAPPAQSVFGCMSVISGVVLVLWALLNL